MSWILFIGQPKPAQTKLKVFCCENIFCLPTQTLSKQLRSHYIYRLPTMPHKIHFIFLLNFNATFSRSLHIHFIRNFFQFWRLLFIELKPTALKFEPTYRTSTSPIQSIIKLHKRNWSCSLTPNFVRHQNVKSVSHLTLTRTSALTPIWHFAISSDKSFKVLMSISERVEVFTIFPRHIWKLVKNKFYDQLITHNPSNSITRHPPI